MKRLIKNADNNIIDLQEPSSLEYGKAVDQAQKNLNKWPGWSITINNLGFNGYVIKTPYKDYIDIFQSNEYRNRYYTISGTGKLNGKYINNNQHFSSIDEVMNYLISLN